MNVASRGRPQKVPPEFRLRLMPVARRVFWWGRPEDWLDDVTRFTAQVMTYGDWDDVCLVAETLGEDIFRQTLQSPPSGVFDLKSWTYWHCRYQLDLPPLPSRCLEADVPSAS